MAGHWLRRGAALLLCGGIFIGFVAAQDDTKAFKLPKVIEKNATPANVDDLKQMEEHVQQVLKKVIPAVVGIRVGPGQGSGVIINEDGYILTAGHVSGKPGQTAVVVMPDGTQVRAKTLGQNKGIDSGMVKINEDELAKLKKKLGGNLPHLDMGKSSQLVKGQWVIGIGHPGGFRPNRTPVVRVGRILYVDGFVIRTDCTLVGGDSGGPLFDMQGNVIGIHSRIGGFNITENMHVPVDTFRKEWDKLAKGDSYGGQLGQMETVRSAGGKLVFEKKDALNKDNDAAIPSPKDKNENSYFKAYAFRMKAGHTYTIDLQSGDKSGKKLDTFLRLETPEAKMIAEDDDGAGFPHSRIVHKALKDGDYRVVATSFEPGQTGNFTVKIFDADYADALVQGKVDVLRSIKLPTPAVAKLVTDFAKNKVALHLNAILVDDKGDPLPNKEITLQWDKGTETKKSDKNGVIRWPLAAAKAKRLAMDLPKGARAMLALTDADGMSIGLKFSEGDPSIEKVKGAGGKVVKTFDGALTTKDPLDKERTKSHFHVHEFQMKAGKTYTLDLMSEDFDSFLRIEDESKAKLADDDDGGGFLNSRIVFTPKEDGTYRMVVTSFDGGQTGVYRLTIRETNAQPTSKNIEKK
ncbi:MAG TPA: trypsin-like peptidase domain-containing protein [Gemmataceae bacterium]|nr:trypsin-like peptidase domain-containing protein [Gemmataceae bacterium]